MHIQSIVNGEVRQDARGSDMINSVAVLIESDYLDYHLRSGRLHLDGHSGRLRHVHEAAIVPETRGRRDCARGDYR